MPIPVQYLKVIILEQNQQTHIVGGVIYQVKKSQPKET